MNPLVLLALAAGGAFLYKKSQEDTPEPSPPPAPGAPKFKPAARPGAKKLAGPIVRNLPLPLNLIRKKVEWALMGGEMHPNQYEADFGAVDPADYPGRYMDFVNAWSAAHAPNVAASASVAQARASYNALSAQLKASQKAIKDGVKASTVTRTGPTEGRVSVPLPGGVAQVTVTNLLNRKWRLSNANALFLATRRASMKVSADHMVARDADSKARMALASQGQASRKEASDIWFAHQRAAEAAVGPAEGSAASDKQREEIANSLSGTEDWRGQRYAPAALSGYDSAALKAAFMDPAKTQITLLSRDVAQAEFGKSYMGKMLTRRLDSKGEPLDNERLVAQLLYLVKSTLPDGKQMKAIAAFHYNIHGVNTPRTSKECKWPDCLPPAQVKGRLSYEDDLVITNPRVSDNPYGTMMPDFGYLL
jgi:hypothetical protein